jgi:hypothetical protein
MSSPLYNRVVPTYANLSTDAPSLFRSLVSNTALQVSTGSNGSYMFGYNFINPNVVNVFVKLYSLDIQPTVGTTIPFMTVQIAPSSSVVLYGSDIIYYFTDLIWIAVTTELLDTGTTAPASSIMAHISWKSIIN